MTDPRVRHVVGCMTGTSLDGLDCALTRITGTGLDMTAKFLGLISRPFDDAFRATLRHLAEGNPAPPIEYMRAARTLGVLHADAVEALLREHGEVLSPGRGVLAADAPRGRGGLNEPPQAPFPGVDFVVAHGQTIWHAPQDTLSWQLFDPWPLVRHLGVPVCYDLRQADLIAGGQGAPITPIADWVMYREQANTVINLGGIANVTMWSSDGWIEAGDLWPCNIVLDGLTRTLHPGHHFDRGGAFARAGVDPDIGIDSAVVEMMRSCVEDRLGNNWRSMGREPFSQSWFKEVLADFRNTALSVYPEDMLIAGAAYAIADSVIGLYLPHAQQEPDIRYSSPRRIVLAGGGVRNDFLMECLREYTAHWAGDVFQIESVTLSDDLGIPCEAREAMGFAVLGALSQDGVPITLPRVTGATNPGVAGCWVYPK